jgi:RNA recognition motif-containing protein
MVILGPQPIQTVLAINLEMDVPTVEGVTACFSKYGELTQIRIIRPTSILPTYLKEFTMWVPDLGVNTCAIVEFETQEQAQAACREINMINRADGKLRVALLKPGARIRRTLYRKYKEDDESKGTTKQETTTVPPPPTVTKVVKQIGKKQKTQLNLKVFNSKMTPLDSGNGSDGSAEISHSSEDENINAQRATNTRRVKATGRDMLQVVRQPIGPDGTRGFNRNVRVTRK